MTIKQAIDIAIASGMTTFTVAHHTNTFGKTFEQTIDTINNFIEGYEDDIVMSIYLGNYYTSYRGRHEPYVYPRPTHCHIVFRNKNEII